MLSRLVQEFHYFLVHYESDGRGRGCPHGVRHAALEKSAHAFPSSDSCRAMYDPAIARDACSYLTLCSPLLQARFDNLADGSPRAGGRSGKGGMGAKHSTLSSEHCSIVDTPSVSFTTTTTFVEEGGRGNSKS